MTALSSDFVVWRDHAQAPLRHGLAQGAAGQRLGRNSPSSSTMTSVAACEVRAEGRQLVLPEPPTSNNEHLRLLLDDPSDCALLHRAAERLANADVPEQVLQALRLGRMVALRKPNGRVRALVVGDVFRGLVARALAQHFAGAFQEACLPYQFGLGTRAGTEGLYKLLQTATELDPRATVLSIDAVGAYDHVSRQAMLEGLRSRPALEPLLPLARQFYGSASSYTWLDDNGGPLAAARHAAAYLREQGYDAPPWASLQQGQPPPRQSDRHFGDFLRGWQHGASLASDKHALELHLSHLDAASRALLLSQAGPHECFWSWAPPRVASLAEVLRAITSPDEGHALHRGPFAGNCTLGRPSGRIHPRAHRFSASAATTATPRRHPSRTCQCCSSGGAAPRLHRAACRCHMQLAADVADAGEGEAGTPPRLPPPPSLSNLFAQGNGHDGPALASQAPALTTAACAASLRPSAACEEVTAAIELSRWDERVSV
eukprot:s4895_g8.t1